MERIKILFVDDEEHILSALRRVLSREDRYHLFFLADASAAVEFVCTEDIDIVVTDHIMPRMSGVDLLAAVRQRAPQALRMLMTGSPDRDIAVRAINEGGIYRLIDKPWGNEALKQVLNDAARAVVAERATRANPGAAVRSFGLSRSERVDK